MKCIVCKKASTTDKGRTCSSDVCEAAYRAYLEPSSATNAAILASERIAVEWDPHALFGDGVEETDDEPDTVYPEEEPVRAIPHMRPGVEVPSIAARRLDR